MLGDIVHLSAVCIEIMRREIAVFDFDGTLYSGDSFIDFALFSQGRGRLLLAILKSLPVILAWKTGMASNGKAKQRLFRSLYGGMRYQDFLDACDAFSRSVSQKIRADVKEMLAERQASGAEVYIISASPSEWIVPWAEKNGVRRVIGTGLEVRDGVLTGNFSTPNCYGAEKVRRFSELEPERDGFMLWAYGDSKGDREMIAFSDRGLMV